MILRMTCSNFRGVHKADLLGFSPLTVLVGPSGCGKSSVLEAILLGATGTRSEEFPLALLNRRQEIQKDSRRWLFWKGNDKDFIDISLELDDGQTRRVQRGGRSVTEGDAWPVSMIIPQPGARHLPLSEVYSRHVEEGLLLDSVEIMKRVIPGLQNILMILDNNKEPVIHAVFKDGSVPLALVGDGLVALARLCFELALSPGSTALLEDPEAHQHYRALRMSAKAMVAAMRRGVQLILSTHSLELIDFLLEELNPEEMSSFSVLRLLNKQGELKAVHHPGEEVLSARQDMREDLR